MKVLVLTSWYPCHSAPYGGIFVRDQVYALSRSEDNIDLLVAWPDVCGLSPRRPLESMRFLARKRTVAVHRNEFGVLECSFPVYEWSLRWPGGFPNGSLRGWQKAFQTIVQDWGTPDLIHAHVGLPAGYLAAWTCKAYGIPYVLTEHMSPFPFPSMLRGGVPVPELQEAYRQASVTIAVSPSLADAIRAYGLGDPIVIPNIIDEELFAPCEHKPKQEFIFFFLGHLGEQKGADDLLEAIARWNPPSHIQFVMAGGGTIEQAREFQKKVRRLHISDYVQWIGPLSRKEVAENMRKAHVFVLPSRHESFGVVLLEALASGIPLISTRCGGAESIVRDEKVGVLVDVDNVSQLADALESIYRHYNHYSSSYIRSYYEEHFSASLHAGNVISQYKRVLSENGKFE